MDSSSAVSCTITHVFEGLVHLRDGDHCSVVVRTDQGLYECYPNGSRTVFKSSGFDALIPSPFIKWRTSLLRDIMSAVPQQHDRPLLPIGNTRLHIADTLIDIVGLAQQDNVFVVRDQEALISCSTEPEIAVKSLLDAHRRLSVVVGKRDPVRITHSALFSGTQPLDSEWLQYINCGDDSELPSIDEYCALPLYGRFPDVHSPMLGDSPTSMIPELCQMNIRTPNLGLSPSSVSLTCSSPSLSSGSLSEMGLSPPVLSTPLTISPALLSSPSSFHTTSFTDSPVIPATYEELVEESHEAPHPSTPTPVVAVQSPKRKRPSPPPSPQPEQRTEPRSAAKARSPSVAEKRTSSRARLVPAPKAAKTPKTAARAVAPAPKKAKPIAPPAAPKRALCPLPGRVLRSTRHSTSAVPSSSAVAVTHSVRALATPYRGEEIEHDHVEPDDGVASDGSEWQDDADEEDDEDFRPTKRTRSAEPGPSTTVKATLTVIGVTAKKTGKTKSKSGKGKKKKGGICDWCSKPCARHSDVARHIETACPRAPPHLKRKPVVCPTCKTTISRDDALKRHFTSTNQCKKNLASITAAQARKAEESDANDDAEMDGCDP